jgi:3-hydroxyisobutyrate dehydrogenase-like beta-hydroxyacid dehydrogenase
VTGSVALEVAGRAAPHLSAQHAYVDVNTASPKTMEAVFSAIRDSGAPFTDVAMMGGIPAFGHHVPCLASGNGAEAFKKLMDPYGMDITCVGEVPGQASAIKMFRSIFMKGFLALLLEMLHASRQYRVEPIVMDSIAATMAKNEFLETARLQLSKGVVNAERMSHEMEAVVETLTDLGVPSTMASAARETLQWCSELGLAEHFGHQMPDSTEDILNAIAAATR